MGRIRALLSSVLLPGLVFILGCEGAKVGPPRVPPVSQPEVTLRTPPQPDLPPYTLVGSTASPDGTSWCVLQIVLEETVPRETLRGLWTSLRTEQRTQWARFTCRFYLAGMSRFEDSWADVNEIMIFGASPALAANETEAEPEEEHAVIVERGADYCIIECRGIEIRVPEAEAREVWFPDPVTGDRKRIRVVDPPLR